jgi:light-regulated signal transduction histidine kinase (bacteriophytochrome)
MRDSRDAAGHAVDLSNCDREPIHIPGRVQPHGVLLALSEPDLAVAQVSDNAGRELGADPAELLGRPLRPLIDPAGWEELRAVLASPDPKAGSPFRVAAGVGDRRRAFDGSAHRHGGVLVLELEDAGGPPRDFSRSIREATARLQATRTLREFWRVAAAEVRAVSGFDRASVYRFDADWNGEVVGEDKRDGLESFLGLHYPASDIPAQARHLYALNPVRHIADAGYEPAELVPADNPATGRPLDLSYSVLRSVSPVHVQYLKNMGAGASMSVSLMRDGRLWGLVSCVHHAGPRYVPPDARAACAFLGVLVSLQLAVKEDGEDGEYRDRLRAVRETFLRRLAEAPSLADGLTRGDPSLLDLTSARGAAVAYDGTCALVGATPGEDQVKRLVGWLRAHAGGDVFSTDSLPRLFPEAEAYKDVASGLVAVTTSKAQGHYVLWFRPEVVRTVDWGGDPTKPAGAAAGGAPLSPRTSFALWQETVRLRSLPWKGCEVEAAAGLRDAIVAVVVRRAEELTRLNAELERSNSDLDAFAFVTSHDLKEPLRGIHNYATFLIEDYADKLDADGVAKLRTLARLSHRLEDLIESLLRYSRLGRDDLAAAPADLDEVLRGVLDLLGPTLSAAGVEVRVPRPLPVARCDRVQVELLLSNLLANAAKYTDKQDKWVEVGYTEPVPAADDQGRPRPPVFHVRDNGIGIPEKHWAAVFRMFKRLHGRDKFGGGTGAGLAFAKKVVERHGGTIWVESEVGRGSTFHFTLGG